MMCLGCKMSYEKIESVMMKKTITNYYIYIYLCRTLFRIKIEDEDEEVYQFIMALKVLWIDK